MSNFGGLGQKDKRNESFMGFYKNRVRSTDYLLKKLSGEKDNNMRVTVVGTIGLLKNYEAAGSLVGYLSDPCWDVRFMAIDALVQLKYKDLLPLLYRVIENDPDPRVKGRAIWALGEFGNEKEYYYLVGISGREEYKSKMMQQYISLSIKTYKSRFKDPLRKK